MIAVFFCIDQHLTTFGSFMKIAFEGDGGGVIGGLVGFHGGTTVVMDVVLKFLNLPVLITVGILWYAVTVVIYWLCIRKVEVRV